MPRRKNISKTNNRSVSALPTWVVDMEGVVGATPRMGVGAHFAAIEEEGAIVCGVKIIVS